MANEYMTSLDAVYEYVHTYCKEETQIAYRHFYDMFVEEQLEKELKIKEANLTLTNKE